MIVRFQAWLGDLVRRLARLQAKRPWVVLGLVTVVTAFALRTASKLTVESGFEHLLPDGRPSVQELHRVAARTAGVSTLFIVLEVPAGEPRADKELRGASDALVVELRKLGEPYVGSAENGVHDALQFLEPRAGLYAAKEDLEGLFQDVDARFKYEVAKETGALLDEGETPPPLDEQSIKKRLHLGEGMEQRYPDGYFESADGHTAVVAVRSKVLGSDIGLGNKTLQLVRDTIDHVGLAKYHPKMTYGFAGDLYSGITEVTALNQDLTEVGLIGVVSIATVVLFFYLRVRTLIVMLLTILFGVAWTAGLTKIVVGNLNMATSFVFTIVAGNGLNPAVIYMARYLEARKTGVDLEEGLRVAHRETLVATASACAASSASFASLLTTAFRGFRELGTVGAIGLVLCWLSTVVCLPAILAAFERIAPLERESADGFFARLRASWGAGFGKPFARIIPFAPRTIAVVGVVLSVAGFAGLAHYIHQDPMEYDMGKLRNDRKARATEERYKKLADDITGYVGADGMAMLVDRVDQVEPLRKALYAIRDAAPADKKPFEALYALEDFVPKDQEAKLPTLLKLREKIDRAHRKGFLKDDQWEKIERYMPPADLAPITMKDLPEGIARTFTETDGTRGRIVYISPTKADLTEDARYLLLWAESYRETHLPDGSVVLGSGRAVIYADMWSAVLKAVPIAVVASLAAVVAVVLAAFRRGRATGLVLGGLAVGVGWMAVVLVVMRVKLNFLNFVALPITFGIGVEYAVNIVYRYVREGRGGALRAVRATGGAVVLCSATTILGYLALLGSMNFAVRSLGLVAVIGEICTLLAAMLVLPAALVWMDRGHADPASSAPKDAPAPSESRGGPSDAAPESAE
jgi:predicted RND superfamily exporter protein